jgi:repressor LexA
MALTKRQREILTYLGSYSENNGYAPSFEEIAEQFNYNSLATVHEHLSNLERKGYIKRSYNESRAIEILPSECYPRAVDLPLLGAVAAGVPIESMASGETMAVPEAMLRRGGDHYVLKVRGQSMVEGQIADGDYVVIRKQEQADNGEKVVAMVDGGMTLKKFYHKRGTVTLQPCNSTMDPIVVDPSKKNVQVLGVLVGVIRKC